MDLICNILLHFYYKIVQIICKELHIVQNVLHYLAKTTRLFLLLFPFDIGVLSHLEKKKAMLSFGPNLYCV